MKHAFTVQHALPQRTRIRWAGDAAGKGLVTSVAADIETIDSVFRASPRPTTGSIVIDHEDLDWNQLQRQLETAAGMRFIEAPESPAETGLEVFNRRLGELDRGLRDANLDLRSLTFLVLLTMAIAQALRGRVGVSSMSLVWYALSVAARSSRSGGAPADSDADNPERLKPI